MFPYSDLMKQRIVIIEFTKQLSLADGPVTTTGLVITKVLSSMSIFRGSNVNRVEKKNGFS